MRTAVLSHGGTNLENDVTDVEDRQNLVVVVALQLQVFLQPSKPSIADIGAVDEAEEIQQGDSRDDIQINLPPQSRFRLGVESEQCIAVAVNRQFHLTQSNISQSTVKERCHTYLWPHARAQQRCAHSPPSDPPASSPSVSPYARQPCRITTVVPVKVSRIRQKG